MLLISSCNKERRSYDSEDIVAQVGDRLLLKEDLESIIPEYQLMHDSSQYIQAFVESWVRDNMLIEDAKSKFSDNAEINELVEEYKESLILHRYKKALIEDKMDSIISEEELRKYYETYKQNFNADEPLFRIKLFRCSRLHPMLDEFRTAWEGDERIIKYDRLKEFCAIGNTRCFKDSTLWVTENFIKNQLPEELTTKIDFTRQKSYEFQHHENYYFFMIKEIIKKGEPAPFNSVKKKLYTIVLNNKKTSLSKELTQKIYTEGIENGWIKINLE